MSACPSFHFNQMPELISISLSTKFGYHSLTLFILCFCCVRTYTVHLWHFPILLGCLSLAQPFSFGV